MYSYNKFNDNKGNVDIRLRSGVAPDESQSTV